MLTMLQNWQGKIEVNGQQYVPGSDISRFSNVSGPVHIKLYPKQNNRVAEGDKQEIQKEAVEPKQIRITVKKYMTEKSSPTFDFMAKWNNNEPMPLRTMVGTVDRETRGMVHMKLHGDIYAAKICTCMACGRRLTNPVSQYFGIGPECGGHNYVSPFDSEQELRAAVAEYKKKLQNITWEGWVVKSAITEQEEV